MSPGSWSITLSANTPRSIIDALQYFQCVVISTGRHNPTIEGNGQFNSGRYAGVITGLDFQSLSQGRGPVISGDGMATWLGNASKVGPVIEGNNTPGGSGNGSQFTSASYATVVNTLRPSSVGAGTIYSMPTSATYTGGFVWKLPSEALTSFAQQVTQGPLPTQIAEWRVNNNCTLDFGPVASLYRTTPIVAIVSKNTGLDMSVRGLSGVAELIEDVKDYTTRVVVLASGQGTSTALGAANISDVGGSNPYTDFFGHPVTLTRMVSASSVSSLNATQSAQAALLPYTTPADQVRLSSDEYDIKGDLQVGDYVWLYDPDAGFVDTNNEIVFRGQRINPTKQRVIQADWPVTSDMTVSYRDQSGNWYDLTDYVMFEDGNTTNLTVGGFNRNLISTSEPVGTRPQPDNTTPGVPVFGAFSSTTYQGTSDGRTKSQIQVQWSTPTNTDGTTLIDLAHYEVRYRPDLGFYTTNPTYSALNLAGYTYATLNAIGGTYANLIPTTVSDWKVTFVAGGVNQLLIQELTPNVLYDFQIRAVDTANPPNYGAWSATSTYQAQSDTIAPPTPDTPTVATNMASVQVTWDCGSASGGTFNQAVDLHHIEVHGSYDPLFIPTNATKLGNLPANIGNITGQIPVVGSFTIPPNLPPANAMYVKIIAVDEAGNKSNPSASAGSTATLWSNAYITDLSVSKLTAGTVTASIIMGGVIETAAAGQRVAMDSTGVHAYDSFGNITFDLNSNSSVLTLSSSSGGEKITIDASAIYPIMRFYDTAGSNNAFINAFNLDSNTAGIGVNSGTYVVGGSTYFNRLIMAGPTGAALQVLDTTQTALGGFVQVTSNYAALGISGGSGSNNGSLTLTYVTGNTDTNWILNGYHNDNSLTAPGATEAVVAGQIRNILAGTTSLTWTYGPTMVSHMTPTGNIFCSTTSATPASMFTNVATTGFTFQAAGALGGGWDICFWAHRNR